MSKKTPTYNDTDMITLEGLPYIRHRHEQFGCDPFNKAGIYLLVRELLDNSIDEARMDPTTNHIIRICFIKKRKGLQVIVKDTGRGIPLSTLERSFTKQGTSAKWEESYVASSGSHGVGSKVTAAMSKVFAAVTSRNGEGRASLLVKDTKTICVKSNKKKKLASGVITFFEPHTDHMHTISEFFDIDNAYDDLISLMEFVTVFVPNVVFQIQTSKISVDTSLLGGTPDEVYNLLDSHMIDTEMFTDNKITPVEYALKTNGLSSRVKWQSDVFKEKSILVDMLQANKPIKNAMGYDVRFYITNDFELRAASTLGAVNMIRINDKTSIHNTVIVDCIKEILSPYVTEQYASFFNESYKLPIHTITSITWQHATFTGQHKHRFTDTWFGKGFHKHLMLSFNEMDKSYWEDLHNIIADDIKVRYERKHKLDLKLSKSDKNLAFELSKVGCFYECKSNDKNITELIICEGTSAGDSIKQVRDIDTQAVFKLRGKPINALRSTFKESMKNEIYADLLSVLGTSPEDTTLSDMRFGKILIMADSDDDGYHITALLIGILYTINPMLLENGKTIVASPPLYIMSHRNNEMYVRDNRGIIDLKASAYMSILKIELVVNGNMANRYELTGKYLRSVCCLIEHLSNRFTQIGTKLNIDAHILEQLTHCVDDLANKDYANVARKLGLKSCGYEVASDAIIMDTGEVDLTIPLSGLVHDITTQLLPELQAVHWDNIDFCVTTRHSSAYHNECLSIMEIHELFKKIYNSFSITRMKGIGELPDGPMKSTCLDPATRSYVVIKSLGDLKRMYDMLGVDTAARKHLVKRNVI